MSSTIYNVSFVFLSFVPLFSPFSFISIGRNVNSKVYFTRPSSLLFFFHFSAFSCNVYGHVSPRNLPFLIFSIPRLFRLTPGSILQHRSLQPTGPPTQGPSQQHSHARLTESFDAIRQEFDVLASDLGLLRNQRDDYESKGTSILMSPHR